MTQPLIEIAARYIEQYTAARDAQTEVARKYLANTPPELSLAATACHRALQFERQAQALASLKIEQQAELRQQERQL